MTERKPVGMSFENWVDQLLRQARRDGKFDESVGTGEPIEELQRPYDPLWWAKSFVKREGVQVIPPELELRKELAEVLNSLPRVASEDEVRKRIGSLNDRIRKHNATVVSGPASTLVALDEEAVLAKWREARSGPTADGS